MKFAAIDIGSNAVRLLFCNVYEHERKTVFKKAELIRVPIRLGENAFTSGCISLQKANDLVKTLQAFKLLIEVHNPIAYRACATSAMRDASNGKQILERISNEANIDVELIDGSTEARLIYMNHIEENLDRNSSYLYIDVGGGSTELTLFSQNQHIFSKSFNIGTIRMLNEQIEKAYWADFKDWIKSATTKFYPVVAIGSGGNINKLHKIARLKDSKPLTYTKLEMLFEEINSYTYQERIELLGLKPDRADVIIPACKIFLSVMKNASIDKIFVPEIGLSDGIVHELYESFKTQKT
ncbi:MAG: exopolyphosphatase [Bacteroidia bacterium]|nr:exopolyphosphatase [Bacteroidia bacterium]